MIIIPPRSGVAFLLATGRILTVTDIEGEQVSDLFAANAQDVREVISSGRSLDYAETLFLSTGSILYSNRSRPMLTIIEDTVGRHDFLLTPCSADTFRILYGDSEPHRGCEGNLAEALRPFGIAVDDIPVCFNCFMNVQIEAQTGRISVAPPLSRAGDSIRLRAEMDLVIGLTACSAGQSNNFSYKPIGYTIT